MITNLFVIALSTMMVTSNILNHNDAGIKSNISVRFYNHFIVEIDSHNEESNAHLVEPLNCKNAEEYQNGTVQSCKYYSIPVVKDFSSTRERLTVDKQGVVCMNLCRYPKEETASSKHDRCHISFQDEV